MVYYDANKFVLLEYSFPARAVVNMMVPTFKYNYDDNIYYEYRFTIYDAHTYS